MPHQARGDEAELVGTDYNCTSICTCILHLIRNDKAKRKLFFQSSFQLIVSQ